MKDSVIRWIAAFILLTVIALAAIFVVDDDEVARDAIQEESLAFENEISSIEDSRDSFDQDGNLDPKIEFQEKKPEDKFDRTRRSGKPRRDRPEMSKPLPPMMPPMMGEGFLPPMMPPMMGEGFLPPMMREGFLPPMMSPMMGEDFEIIEFEIFEEIEQIFDSILYLLESIEKLDFVGSEADDGISQSGELTLSLIEEVIKETFDKHFEEATSGLVDRVAKDAITQIIEGLTQESVEQSLKGTTESN